MIVSYARGLCFSLSAYLKAGIRCSYVLLALYCCGGAVYAQPPKTLTKLTPADYFEIYDLYAAYSVAIDTGNGPGRVATFTPDGQFRWGQSKHLPETMDVLSARTSSHGLTERPAGGHVQTLIHITPTAEGVNATCYAIIGGSKADADGNVIGTPAFYTDTLVKTPKGWRFKTREVFIGAPGDKGY